MPRLDLPSGVREQLLLEVYRQAGRLDWEFLGNTEKTAQYRKWIEDPRVGGVLLEHHREKDIRVWIKDVPMKEYARSQEGIGHYVPYIPMRFRGPDEIINAAFGPDWKMIPDSVDVKPNHCVATDRTRERYVCWGREPGFKDLIYAAINVAVTSYNEPAIVITTRDGEHISDETMTSQKRIAKHCGVDLTYLHRSMIANPDYIG